MFALLIFTRCDRKVLELYLVFHTWLECRTFTICSTEAVVGVIVRQTCRNRFVFWAVMRLLHAAIFAGFGAVFLLLTASKYHVGLKRAARHFWRAVASSRKASVGFVMSARPSVRLYQRVSRWTDFRKIWCLGLSWKCVDKLSKCCQNRVINMGHFTWRRKCVLLFAGDINRR